MVTVETDQISGTGGIGVVGPQHIEVIEEKPVVGDLRIKVQRSNRFRWYAILEIYKQPYGRISNWDAVLGYGDGEGWRTGPFRWWVVFRVNLDVKTYRAQQRKERKRQRLARTE